MAHGPWPWRPAQPSPSLSQRGPAQTARRAAPAWRARSRLAPAQTPFTRRAALARSTPLPAARRACLGMARARPGPLPPLLARSWRGHGLGSPRRPARRALPRLGPSARGLLASVVWRARCSRPRRGPDVARPQPLLPGAVRCAARGARPCA
jgi:hypothetical protein